MVESWLIFLQLSLKFYELYMIVIVIICDCKRIYIYISSHKDRDYIMYDSNYILLVMW